MKNNIDELRGVLFDTLRDLRSGKIEVDRAKAVNETAQVLINSLKAEADLHRYAGGKSSFVCIEAVAEEAVDVGADKDEGSKEPAKLEIIDRPEDVITKHGRALTTRVNGAGTITQHKMR
jgi:hypothetical protein